MSIVSTIAGYIECGGGNAHRYFFEGVERSARMQHTAPSAILTSDRTLRLHSKNGQFGIVRPATRLPLLTETESSTEKTLDIDMNEANQWLGACRVKSTANRPISEKKIQKCEKYMHVNHLLGYKRSPHAVRYPTEDALPQNVPSGAYNGQTRLRLTEHSSGVPSSYRFSLLPPTSFVKKWRQRFGTSTRTVRRASHVEVFRRTRYGCD